MFIAHKKARQCRALSARKANCGSVRFPGPPLVRKVVWADSKASTSPAHATGLITALACLHVCSVVSSLSPKAAPGRFARPPTAARFIPTLSSDSFGCLFALRQICSSGWSVGVEAKNRVATRTLPQVSPELTYNSTRSMKTLALKAQLRAKRLHFFC